jgi:histidine triad (HIT) family protein
MQPDCIFCKIAAGEIDSEFVYEDDLCVAFRDLSPQAPIHVLLIPRRHIENVGAMTQADAELAGHLVVTAPAIAAKLGLAEAGYRVVANVGQDGGQSVDHLHIHILGGRQMRWPPG